LRNFGQALGEFAGELAFGQKEKEATLASELMGEQATKVDILTASLESYKGTLDRLKGDSAVTPEQIAQYEGFVVAQDALLTREMQRLDVMRGINTETEKAIILEEKKTEAAAVAIEAAPFDFEAAFAQAEFEDELLDRQRERAEERLAIERDTNAAIQANYIGSANSIASIITNLAGKQKGAAQIALLIQKGAAAASVIANAEAAKFQAMATTPPYAWPQLLASIETSRAISLGAIAASTISGLSGGGGGGGTAGGGQAAASAAPETSPIEPQRPLEVRVADISKVPDDTLIDKRGLAVILGQLVEDNIIQGIRV